MLIWTLFQTIELCIDKFPADPDQDACSSLQNPKYL